MEKNQNEITARQIWVGILLVFILIGGYLIADSILIHRNKPASQYPDYDALSTLHSLILVERVASSNVNVNASSTTDIKLEVRGRFSRMYLYVETSVDSKLLTDWDSIYVKFNTIPQISEDFKSGGHLFRPKSLEVPQIDTATRLLYNTSVVPYLPTIPYSATRIPITVNWFDLVFNANGGSTSTARFDTFLSTEGRGWIENITLYYSCAPENFDCYIKKI